MLHISLTLCEHLDCLGLTATFLNFFIQAKRSTHHAIEHNISCPRGWVASWVCLPYSIVGFNTMDTHARVLISYYVFHSYGFINAYIWSLFALNISKKLVYDVLPSVYYMVAIDTSPILHGLDQDCLDSVFGEFLLIL